MIPIYIGWDKVETVAYHVFAHSIIRRSSQPVAITPVNRDNIKAYFNRPRGEKDSTDFSNSRFIVPALQEYRGWCIFADADMLCLDDIVNLWEQRDDKYAIMCKKHNHVPDEEVKFLDQEQTKYPRKNWSSLMLMNCGKLRQLSKHEVNTAPGLFLHRMQYLGDEEIGDIEGDWNHLVGYDEPVRNPSLLHYTSGGPWHGVSSDFVGEWKAELHHLLQGDNPVDYLEML